MIRLPHYKIIEAIAKSKNTTILRALRMSDESPVVIKLLNSEYPTSRELSDFIREYEIMVKLGGDGTIMPIELLKFNNGLAIVMEDIGGESVAKLMGQKKYTIAEKLTLAISMTEAIMQLHKQNIIHKDINPTNFIWNTKTKELKIIDFGISAELPREASQSVDIGIVEGTLNYISPEQTGRINRSIDYRTDLYSLGITFYEMFTGCLPFTGSDEMDLIYCQIAKMPAAPVTINPKLGEVLSEIIMKLISKPAEARYQSALGLKRDLEYCLKNINMPKRSEAVFIPGKDDVSDRFEIPDFLYGREKEIEALIKGFERASYGGAELLLVSGHSGIGKSSIIQEIRKPITLKKGYFATGSYSQFDMNTPYSAIAQAFSELLKQLFFESQQGLELWKKRLTEAVGANGQIIIDLIPELEQIIGRQKPPAEINPLEAQNRFLMSFLEFIKVFAQKEHPLIVFLDDMQRCDASSLELIKYVLSSDSIKYVMFIVAYRDTEVGIGHPLKRMLDDLRNTQAGLLVSYTEIVLKPLEIHSINRLVADSLHITLRAAEPLSKIVFQKTKGNPFFINRLLKLLQRQGIISFLPEKGKWTYDLERVKSAEISENVVELLVKNLQTLPEKAMENLRLIACIGSQFDLKTVSRITKKNLVTLGSELWIAIERNIIIPLNNNYRLMKTLKSDSNFAEMDFRFAFVHDHLRQAVYSTIPFDKKKEIHLSIGREYLRAFREEKKTDAIFELVGHLNIASELLKGKRERTELMMLNIKAGVSAKKSTAFAAAQNYFETAYTLMTAKEWAKVPVKLFLLLKEQADSALLSGDFKKANRICTQLSKMADTKLQKGAVSNIKILIFLFQGKLIDTIKEARKALSLFGIIIPDNGEEKKRMSIEGVEKMQAFFAKTPVEELTDLPIMEDPEKLMTIQLLYQLIAPAIQVDTDLYILTILTMFDLTITYGSSPLAAKCFGDCGVLMGTRLKDYEMGYKMGLVAFELTNKFKAESLRSAVYYIFTYVSQFRAPLQESIKYFDMSNRTGIETGDLMHASYALAHKLYMLFWSGTKLSDINTEIDGAKAFLKRAKGVMPLLLASIMDNTIERFCTPLEPSNTQLCEKKAVEIMDVVKKSHNMAFLCRIYFFNTFLSLIMGDMVAAEKWSRLADGSIYAAPSDYPIADHYLFKGLIMVRRFRKASEKGKAEITQALSEIKRNLEFWAENCHENFDHKFYLLSAEICIIENQPLETITSLFGKAIKSASDNGFAHMKALCNEHFADFWLLRGEEVIGKAYLKEAYYAYKQWGALRKTAFMENRLVKHFISTDIDVQSSIGQTSTTSSIDKNSILKSAQAISSEIKIDRLLTKLIDTLIENAGAQRGCLLLKNETDGQLYVEAVQNISPSYLKVMHASRLTESDELCVEVVNYVTRTKEALVINDAVSNPRWQNNSYIIKKRIKSVLCIPVFYQNKIKGIVYLENNLSDNVFTMERLETLKILSSQAAIALENARLYENMEEKVRDRTIQLNDANSKLRELSIRDHLTGLHNRRYLFENEYSKIMQQLEKIKIQTDIKDEKRESELKVFGIFLLDIDFFKSVNDTYGHASGDSVLLGVARLLKRLVKKDELVVRWGGEEFLLVLYDRKPEELKRFAKRVLKKMKDTPFEVGESIVIHKTCSLGYSEMPLDTFCPTLLNLEQMINISDFALYCAKENGRNSAGHFKLIKTLCDDEELRKELCDLSKNSVLNSDYFEVEFV